MELDELYSTANELAQIHWNIPYTGKIELVDARWKRTGAKVILGKIPIIRMSRSVNERMGSEKIKQFLLHELVHWYLYSNGKPYDDDAEEFVKECIRVGAPFSATKKARWAAGVYGNNGRRIKDDMLIGE
ncbi:hypothetical protein ACFVS2_21755 [Brevibacillus sp. NPDC058079]|uniref:hypothetical protein n=1 Tax=Brevibacillus sp. NPDC058079 TaxID=3346330 RepID=UPI0036F17D4B